MQFYFILALRHTLCLAYKQNPLFKASAKSLGAKKYSN